jgi:hypothetical protein
VKPPDERSLGDGLGFWHFCSVVLSFICVFVGIIKNVYVTIILC